MKRSAVIEKEKRSIERQEERRNRQALRENATGMKERLEAKIPAKIYEKLQGAFSKAFEIVFEKGVGVIEKTYCKDELLKDYEIYDFAVQRKGSRKEFKNLHRKVKGGGRLNVLLAAAEGSLLGLLGIGMPDIVLFTGMLLKGAYETSLRYGFDYDRDDEKYWILQLMEAAFKKGESYLERNESINEILEKEILAVPSDEEMKAQMLRTSGAMAADMLFMKFVQGLPVIGIVGGVMNPVYYQRFIGYVQLKYRRRYLLKISAGREKQDEKFFAADGFYKE